MDRIHRWILFGVVSVLTVVVFYPVLDSYFVTDDWRLIYISSPVSQSSVLEYFTSSGGWYRGLYRPLVRMAFLIDYHLYHLNPIGYHVTNLLFHIACTILVFYFVKMLAGSEMTGSFAALIFAVQPLYTEAVSYISGRGDIIFTFFYLLSCISFLHYLSDEDKKRKTLLLSGFFFLLSLLSKESAITLPVIIFLIDYYYNKKSGNTYYRLNFKNYMPFASVLILYGFIKLFIVGTGSLYTRPGLSRFLGVGYSFLQLFAPINIDTFNFSNMSGFILNSIIVLNLIVLLLLFLYLDRDKKRAIPFFMLCVLWIIITSFPLYLGSGARYLYISGVASSMLIGFVLTNTLNAVTIQTNYPIKILVLLITVSIILTSSIRILHRNKHYNYAGNIAKGILTQLKNKYPTFPNGSSLYFINFPHDWVRDTELWVNPIPNMGMAVQVKYGSTSLKVHSERMKLSTTEEKLQFLERNYLKKYIKEGRHFYVFEYQDGHVTEITEMLRGKLRDDS